MSEERRFLQPSEVKEIIESLPRIRLIQGVRDDYRKRIQASFENQLRQLQIYPSLIPKLKKRINEKYLQSLATPGDMVGTLSAQVMESFTQMTLNMFHAAGLSEKNVSLGLPRLKEVLNVTPNPKVVGFTFFPSKKFTKMEDLRENVQIVEISIGSLIKSMKPLEGPTPALEEFFYGKRKSPYGFSCSLNVERMFRQGITPGKLARFIEKIDEDISCRPPPHESLKENGSLVITVEANECADDNERQSYFDKIVVPSIKTSLYSGILGVSAVYPKEVNGEWILEGNGGKLLDLLSSELCDATKTINDNMWDIFVCLGIEAVRSFLIEEIIRIMSFGGGRANVKHVTLLVDRMTLDGTISSVSRYGMDREQYSPLAKASFEETVRNLLISGIFGETDKLRSVSSSIITGRTAPAGAEGLVEIIIDQKKLDMIDDALVEEEYVYF